MSKEAFDAVINVQVLRELGRAGIVATTTPTMPLRRDDFSAATGDQDDWAFDEATSARAVEQARAAYAASSAQLISQARAASDIVGSGAIAGQVEASIALARTACKTALVTRGVTSMHFNILVDESSGMARRSEMTSQVQRYAERLRLEPVVLYDVDQLHTYNFDILCYAPHSAKVIYELENNAGVFSLEAAAPSPEWTPAAAAFQQVEPVEQYEARALRLFAALQNGPALGSASVQRLRDLEQASREEGAPFSLNALEALVAFANAHPEIPRPSFTLTPSGGIVAEWRMPAFSVTLYFVSPLHVQYLVKRPNPWHRAFGERTSGSTTVDRVSDTVKALLPSGAWPIRG